MPFQIQTRYRPEPYYTESQHIAGDFISWGYRVDFVPPQTQAANETSVQPPRHENVLTTVQTSEALRSSPDPRPNNSQNARSLGARRQINLRLNLNQHQPSPPNPPSSTLPPSPSSLSPSLEQMWLNEYIAHMGPSTLEGVHALLSSTSPLSTSQNQNPPQHSHNIPITPNPSCLAILMVNMTRGLGAIASMVPGRNIVPFSGSLSRSQSRRHRPDQRQRPRGLIRGRGLGLNGLHGTEIERDRSPTPPPRPRYGVTAPGPRVAGMRRTAGQRGIPLAPPPPPQRGEAGVREPLEEESLSEERVVMMVRDMAAMLALDGLSLRRFEGEQGEERRGERGGEGRAEQR